MQEQTTYLPAAAVLRRFGGISRETLWRWMQNPRVNFPKPIYANSRHRLWKLSDLEAWEETRAKEGVNARAS